LKELDELKKIVENPSQEKPHNVMYSRNRVKPISHQYEHRNDRFISSHSAGDILQAFDINRSVVRTAGQGYTTYSFSLRSKLPLSEIFGHHILAMDFSLQSFYLCRSISVLSNSAFGVKSIVQDDAAIVTACANGDLQRVHELFLSGKARPDDVTASNSTLLRVNDL
jgi:hypothetical protein